ncbi:unnamed protein product [Symbiodinium sp. CCMP2592]|nr:unnamed protein product [Symbiodinium sp. CCMP2592]
MRPQFRQHQIPTPCAPKRSMDEEQLCHRLHKRLRIGSPTAARQLAHGHYSQANSVLQQLHAEHLARRQQVPRPDTDTTMTMTQQAWTAGGSVAHSDFAAMTHFVLSDVVQCSHGAQGRCLQCAGRLVQNVPLQVYSDWCTACSSPASSSNTPPPRPCATSVRELTFPAMAALIACLGPEPGERSLSYGGLVDFGATFRWLKDQATFRGDIAIGTFAGDFIAPSYLAEIFKGSQLVEMMNLMGVDLANIGNHDIDFGLANLRAQMGRSAFHYLNSNLQEDVGKEIQQPMRNSLQVKGDTGDYDLSIWRRLHQIPGSSVGRGWAILAQDGIKICVLGTTDIDKMNWAGKKVNGSVRDILAAVDILRMWKAKQLGCSLRVALTHTRTGNDLNLFRAVEHAGLHLDAIVGGHDHYIAFGKLKRRDNGTTFLVKAGADARIVASLQFDLSKESLPEGSLSVVPVVACARRDSGRSWLDRAQKLFVKYAAKADEADSRPLHVTYQGLYDTSSVRDKESRAVNMWLDLMRESIAAEVLFFQAGLIRQDMRQVFERQPLSHLFLLEEFPWADADADARSSLFPFQITLSDLVLTTLPFLARRYWCKAPFNDANRVHVSGFVIEMTNEDSCDAAGQNPIISATFVGGCHRAGALLPVDSGCCTSSLCGRVWSDGAWDARVTAGMKSHQLSVATGQFCVPSKYGSHGEGFHAVGMLCRDAEPADNWGSGREFTKHFGRGSVQVSKEQSLLPAANASSFLRLGFFFKPAMMAMLQPQHTDELVCAQGPQSQQCDDMRHIYSAQTFTYHCKCQLRQGAECTAEWTDNPYPRFYSAPADAFPSRSCGISELLHLSSGVARVVAAWALLVPRGMACGIERCAAHHEAAVTAVEKMDPEVQSRVLLHNGNLLDSQNDWHQASTILVSGDALEDSHVARVTTGLERTQPGTRIASIGRPLGDPNGPLGLQFVRQVVYRTVGSGNANLGSKSRGTPLRLWGRMSEAKARRSNGLGALLLFTAVYMVLQDLWTSTGALPRDLALAVADDAPPEDASAFFTKAGIFIGAGRSSMSVPLRFSQPPHRDARPDSDMGSLRSVQRISGPQLYSRPPSLLPSCPPCASRLPLAQHAARAGPSSRVPGRIQYLESQVNRLLVKRMTVAQAYSEVTFSLVANFFLTTFPTNMLKFPVFEIINRAMMFTDLSPGVSAAILYSRQVTNYRFRKSMGWEIKASLLYQAYIPTVARDIIYGWARGLANTYLQDTIAPTTFTHKAMVFGLTIWVSCSSAAQLGIISSPCNEWRGYTLQPPDKKLPFNIYFKPINYARSTGGQRLFLMYRKSSRHRMHNADLLEFKVVRLRTGGIHGIGSSIMGIALMFGMLVTPYAEDAFAYMKEHTALALGIVAVLIVAIVMATKQLGRRMGSPRSAQSPTYMLGAKLYHEKVLGVIGVRIVCLCVAPGKDTAVLLVILAHGKGIIVAIENSTNSAMAARRSNGLGPVVLFAAACWLVDLWTSTGALPRDLALAVADDAPPEDASAFFTKVFAAAAQGCTAALVAAILSAMCEPLVNRLLVKRMTVAQAYSEVTFSLVANFFLTTFPTNMLKFPVFEIINRAMMFTDLSPGVSGLISGWLFCTIMLPVTNYRFRKSMGWEIKASLLYQAYIPTVARDIIYGWARGLANTYLQDTIAPTTFTHKAMVFGLTIWVSCIISSPCNEWRGYTLQPPDKKLPFNIYFKPINYARSTGIGSSIMGIALMFGMLVTPYAEDAFAYMKEHTALALGIVAVLIVAIVMATKQLGCSTAHVCQHSKEPRTLWNSGFAHLDRGRRMGSPRSAQSPTYMLGAKLYHAGCCVACLQASSQS